MVELRELHIPTYASLYKHPQLFRTIMATLAKV